MNRRTGRRGSRLWLAVAMVAMAIVSTGVAFDSRPVFDAPGKTVDSAVAGASSDAGNPSFDELFHKGVGHLRDGRPEEAVAVFEQARRLRPHVPEVFVNLGFAYIALGAPAAGKASFDKAVELQVTQANAYFGLAESYELLGDLDMALGAMRTYLHLAPKFDRYRKRALAAIWEWEATRNDGGTLATPVAGEGVNAAALTGKTVAYQTIEKDGLPLDVSGLRFTRLDGTPASLALYSGKTIILNVWATWCGPCRAELPSLQRLSERLDRDRFAVVGLSIDKDRDFVREFLRDIGVDFANFIDDPNESTAQMLGVELVPQTFVLGSDGVVRERHIGVRVWDDSEIVARLEDGG